MSIQFTSTQLGINNWRPLSSEVVLARIAAVNGIENASAAHLNTTPAASHKRFTAYTGSGSWSSIG